MMSVLKPVYRIMHKIIINSKIFLILIEVLNRQIKKCQTKLQVSGENMKKNIYIYNKNNYDNDKKMSIININDKNDNYKDFNNIII